MTEVGMNWFSPTSGTAIHGNIAALTINAKPDTESYAGLHVSNRRGRQLINYTNGDKFASAKPGSIEVTTMPVSTPLVDMVGFQLGLHCLTW